MAVDREKLFDGITNGAAWDAGVVFNRTNGIPIDKWSVFQTDAEAIEYASSNPVAYPGQYIAVVPENGDPIAYIIQADGSLKVIGADGGVQSDWAQTDETAMDFIKNKPTIPNTDGFATEDFVSEAVKNLASTDYVDDKVAEVSGTTQIQADWTQEDNTQLDYIKNKPIIPSTEGLASETYVNNQVADVLRYSAQILTDEQKLQAKTNMGVSDSVPLTQEEYDELQVNGKLISTTFYFIYEETES